MLANRAAGFAERDSATGQFLRAADAPRSLPRPPGDQRCLLIGPGRPGHWPTRRGAPGRRQTTSSDPARTGRSGSGRRRNLLDQLVVVGIALADDVDLAFAADGIDLPSRAVEKEIVRVGTDRQLADALALLRVIGEQQRRPTCRHEQAVRGRIERHREVARSARAWPSRGDAVAPAVHHCDVGRAWDVDVDVAPAALDRERFGMSGQGPTPDDMQRLRIENRQGASVAQKELVRGGIEAQVVGVVQIGNARDRW